MGLKSKLLVKTAPVKYTSALATLSTTKVMLLGESIISIRIINDVLKLRMQLLLVLLCIGIRILVVLPSLLPLSILIP